MIRTACLTLVVAAAFVMADGPDPTVPIPSPTEVVVSKSVTYNAELPSYSHFRCDGAAKGCFDPAAYGPSYKPEAYSYKRAYPYPGPWTRFKSKLKGLFAKIKAFFRCKWSNFKDAWTEWCAVVKSDKARFDDWCSCKTDKFKKWWAYQMDLLKVRKQLWDDAQREFHRQWVHFKCQRSKEYEEKKKACGISDKDYDDDASYKKDVALHGVSPVESQYRKDLTFDQGAYKQHCGEQDKLEVATK